MPKERVPASRKLGLDQAQALVAGANRVIVSKGRKLIEYEGGGTGATFDDAVEALLGTTGNLRAPAIRAGKTVLVGFNEEAYERFFD